MDQLLKELKTRVSQENRSSAQLYNVVKTLGAQMFFTNTISRDTVLTFCAALLKMYSNLLKAQETPNVLS